MGSFLAVSYLFNCRCRCSDIAMKLGMVVLNRIIVKLTKLQAFTFCMKKVILEKPHGGMGGGIRPPPPPPPS